MQITERATILYAEKGVVYEEDFKAHLKWKRIDLCHFCEGSGRIPWYHSFTEGWVYKRCFYCGGTGNVCEE